MKWLELKAERIEQFQCIFQMQERQDLHTLPYRLQKEEVKKKSQFMLWAIALMLMLFSVVGEGGEHGYQWTLGKDVHEVSSVCSCKALRDPSRNGIIDQHRSGSASITSNMHIPMAGDNERLKFTAHQQDSSAHGSHAGPRLQETPS